MQSEELNLPELTLENLKSAANSFAREFHGQPVKTLYGATDGKAIGTYVEQYFRKYLQERFVFETGNSALGIDIPSLNVDLKTTSYMQPQSSCPFRNANQKIYGLGYHLLIFVYDKKDDTSIEAALLNVQNVIFVHKERTADFQTTKGILEILSRDGNADDINAFLEDRNVPVDEVGRARLAEQIFHDPPKLGYLTISNALQWRLQYSRAISVAVAGNVNGLENLYI